MQDFFDKKKLFVVGLCLLFAVSFFSLCNAADSGDDTVKNKNQAFKSLKSNVGKVQSIIGSLNKSLQEGIAGAEKVERELSIFENELKNLGKSLSEDSKTMKNLEEYRRVAIENRDNARKKIDEAENSSKRKLWLKITEQWEERIHINNNLFDAVKKQRDQLSDNITRLQENKEELKQFRLLGMDEEIKNQLTNLNMELENMNQNLNMINENIPTDTGVPQ